MPSAASSTVPFSCAAAAAACDARAQSGDVVELDEPVGADVEDRLHRPILEGGAGPLPTIPECPSSTCAPTPNTRSSTAACGRRRGARSGRRWSGRDGDHRSVESVRCGQVLRCCAQGRRQAADRRRRLAGSGAGITACRPAAEPAAAAGAVEPGLSEPVRAAVARLAAWRRGRAARPAGAAVGLAGAVQRRPDRAFRRRSRGDRAGVAGAGRCARGRAGAAPGLDLREALLHRTAARRPCQPGGLCACGRAAGRRARPAGRRDASGAVPRTGRFRGPRGAGLHRRRRDARPIRSGCGASVASSSCAASRRWRRPSPTCRARSRTRCRSRGAAT